MRVLTFTPFSLLFSLVLCGEGRLLQRLPWGKASQFVLVPAFEVCTVPHGLFSGRKHVFNGMN